MISSEARSCVWQDRVLVHEDPMASLIPLENLYKTCLIFTVACYGFLVVGFARWLFHRNVHERGQSSRCAVPQRNSARRRGESSLLDSRGGGWAAVLIPPR